MRLLLLLVLGIAMNSGIVFSQTKEFPVVGSFEIVKSQPAIVPFNRVVTTKQSFSLYDNNTLLRTLQLDKVVPDKGYRFVQLDANGKLMQIVMISYQLLNNGHYSVVVRYPNNGVELYEFKKEN